jgi:hypothetical protein
MVSERRIAAARDDRAMLAALRDRLADELDEATNPHVVASLAPQLLRTIAALFELKAPPGSRVDELKQRRARRQAAAGFLPS